MARFLRESLGGRPGFVRILEWNLETAPFFLESEYAGQNLSEWAEAQGGGVKAAGGSQKPIARSRELGA